LEKEAIDGYTTIPKWGVFGIELLAFTFIRSKPVTFGSQKELEKIWEVGREWAMKQPNVIMCGGCQGLGSNSFMISLHKNYADFVNFTYNLKIAQGGYIQNIDPILANLHGKEILKPFHLKYWQI